MKADVQKKILVASTSCVQFRNFKLKKLYKRIVTLQNVSNKPARFQIEKRPYRSKFRIIIKPVIENRSIVPPGMQLQLIILFRCDDIDTPEEMLVLNVQHGKPLIIRLRGYKDPPILLGTCLSEKISFRYSDTDSNAELLDQVWHPEIAMSFDNLDVRYILIINNDHGSLLYLTSDFLWCKITFTHIRDLDFQSTTSSSTESLFTDIHVDDDFVGMTFDCKKGFIGEEVYIPIKLKNVGGVGRFFIMSEIDWFSMNILDITDKNILKLPCFTLWPAYFLLKGQEEITFHMHFSPECYGIHVEKMYILCDNCTLLATEIIGDGLIYEPNFIQLNKVPILQI
ncbi:PREDICTED: uncharacterized protein LOC108551284 [Eufriesea mexicana]|uniref:uncharacterized protein LOC108551284 n=1 Tax=Eufriesea mexicana TaxID=516756 RepID=UPI00083BAEF4|nr:PREDICTED: uncharacterized protein LOC108551284 [Eufriesea mexicana]